MKSPKPLTDLARTLRQNATEADQRRTQSLESNGYTVLRFWNNDVLQNTQGVLEEIRHTLRLITPLP